VKSNNEEATF